MSAFSLFNFVTRSPSPKMSEFSLSHFPKPLSFPHLQPKAKTLTLLRCKSSETAEDEWAKRLPEKKRPLYAHSLPCIEAWLRQLGFCQSGDDPAAWAVEKADWQANLNLDVTDLYIRYLKTGPGNLEKDVERRFSYALSREDIENAILGGP